MRIPRCSALVPQVRWQRLQPWTGAQSWGFLIRERVEDFVCIEPAADAA